MKNRWVLTGASLLFLQTSQAQLVINEIDYDQASTDTAEFIEIKNTSTSAVDLGVYTVELVNGNGAATVYRTIALPNVMLAADDYFVICGDNANVATCDLDATPDSDLIQNGAPDAIAIRMGATLIDTVSYEGNTAAPYTEGLGDGLIDNPDHDNEGLSRFPDGSDSNQNNIDFTARCVTPGTANTSFTDPCNGEAPVDAIFNDGFEELELPTTTVTFDTAKSRLYNQIYFDNRETLYCNCQYNEQRDIDLASCGMESLDSIARAKVVEAEHVFPASQFGNFRLCWREPEVVCGDPDISGRDCCLDTDPLFKTAHNDIMNLVPANGYINGQRSNLNWGIVDGEAREYGACDFETDTSIRRAEPAESVRGDIARTMLYMSELYGFNLSNQDKQLYAAWNNADPVDSWEIERNNRIKSIQGVGNSFVENYQTITLRTLKRSYRHAHQLRGDWWNRTQAKPR